MEISIKTYLYDILNSINEIESYFIDSSRNFNDFVKDVKLKRAIERNLEIIGEALNRINKLTPLVSITGFKQIIGLRNRIIHDYDNVSSELIWGIIIKHLPNLKKEIELLINTY